MSALTKGTLSKTLVGSTTASLSATAATEGTGPYTYQWYRSTTTGFTPGSGNILTGKTSLTLADTGLSPLTTYFYKVIATDAVSATVTYDQLTVQTLAANQDVNQFGMTLVCGQTDMHLNLNSLAVQIGDDQTTALNPGELVKAVDSAGGIPSVVGITADTDEVVGAINFNFKDRTYVAKDKAEISMEGNVIRLFATGAISRFAQVCPDVTVKGGVQAATGASAKKIIGVALDKASGGELIRVRLKTPSYKLDS